MNCVYTVFPLDVFARTLPLAGLWLGLGLGLAVVNLQCVV